MTDSCGGRGFLRRLLDFFGPVPGFVMLARAGRESKRWLGTMVFVGSSSRVRSMTFGVAGGSVFVLFDDKKTTSTASAFRLFDTAGLKGKAGFFVLVAGIRAADWAQVVVSTLLASSLEVLRASRLAEVTRFRSFMRSGLQRSGYILEW